jgi:hypothetical protein
MTARTQTHVCTTRVHARPRGPVSERTWGVRAMSAWTRASGDPRPRGRINASADGKNPSAGKTASAG